MPPTRKKRVRVELNLSSPQLPSPVVDQPIVERVDKPSRGNNVLTFLAYFVSHYPGVFSSQLRGCILGSNWLLVSVFQLLTIAALTPVLVFSALISTCRSGVAYVKNRAQRGLNARPASSVPTQAL